MSDPVTDWQEGEVMRFAEREPDRSYVHDDPITIEIEARLARVETKQDALYAELHAIHLAVLRVEDQFTKLTDGVLGAVQANPLFRRLLNRDPK